MIRPDTPRHGITDDPASTRSFWKKLLIIAAIVTIACQLFALSMLAEDQVSKAASKVAQERSEVANCLKSGDLSRQRACLDNARRIFNSDFLALHESIVPNARFNRLYPNLSPMRSGSSSLVSENAPVQ